MADSSPHPAALPGRHILLALAVVAIWGSNFVVMKVGLAALPPLLFATLRFSFVLMPGIFFVRRPAVSWTNLALYGLLIGAGQFGLVYVALNRMISPGLASLVLQTQVVFTIGLSMWLTGERVRWFQWIAVALAATGIAMIAHHAGSDATPLGLVLAIVAAASWAGGNLVARRTPDANMLAYVIWASLFSMPPLLALSLLIEGPHRIVGALRAASAFTWLAVLWQSVGNTMFGYAAWGWLLARHPAASITPMALLVPIFGMATSAWWLSEAMPAWKLGAAALVLAGLALNVFWPRFAARARTVL